MAIHAGTASMLRESTKEMLFVAKHCISFRKDQEWGHEQQGGCLGFPATVLLFCITDTIGSFHKGDESFLVSIDGKPRSIKKDAFEHFFVLNSPYYNLALTGETIRKIYLNYRNILVHNLALPPGHFLEIGQDTQKPFEVLTDQKGKRYPVIRLVPFLSVSEKAVELFLKNLDAIVPSSQQNKAIHSKLF